MVLHQLDVSSRQQCRRQSANAPSPSMNERLNIIFIMKLPILVCAKN